ncbi:hypothetical protein [Phaeobacter sp.]|uniref:hypothetical protein n=1 Tax=Phaeobacter sp. TaxID=1902409 RepID=UPI0025FAF974|nr:hypothetical protein [Phaeobacter sp.]
MERLACIGAAAIVGLFSALTSPPAHAEAPSWPGWAASFGGEDQGAHEALLQVIDASDHTPAPFTTDGCSGGLSLLWRQFVSAATDQGPRFEYCCVAHDRSYHMAGGATTATESVVARRLADKTLRQCVEAELADVTPLSGAIASAMFSAVRFGGAPCTGLPWRWGYGYPPCETQINGSFAKDAPD